MSEPVRVPVTKFDQAIALLGLPAEKDGAILTSVHVEAGTITGMYTVVNKVLYLTEEVSRDEWRLGTSLAGARFVFRGDREDWTDGLGDGPRWSELDR